MDYTESRNHKETNSAESRNEDSSASDQARMDARVEEVESLLVEGTALLTKFRAEVAEMQGERFIPTSTSYRDNAQR